MSCTPKPNGFADHYPYEKWLFHWGYTPFSDIPKWEWVPSLPVEHWNSCVFMDDYGCSSPPMTCTYTRNGDLPSNMWQLSLISPMTDWFLNISCESYLWDPVSIMRCSYFGVFQQSALDMKLGKSLENSPENQSLPCFISDNGPALLDNTNRVLSAFGWVFWTYFRCLNMSNRCKFSVGYLSVTDLKTHIPMIFPWFSHVFPMISPISRVVPLPKSPKK